VVPPAARAPRTTCGRPREFLANRNVTHISCKPTPIYVDAAWSAASEHASCGCTSGCTNCIRPKERRTSNSTIEYALFHDTQKPEPTCGNRTASRPGAVLARRGRTSVDSTNVLSACITAGMGKHQHANAAQKSCGEEIGSDARWSDGPYQDRDVEPLPLIALRIIAE
jgi:hypothetical protein